MIKEPQISPTSRQRNAAWQYQFINRCRGCRAQSDALEPVLTMSSMPLAGLFCDTQEEAQTAPRFPLTWLYCCRCGLVQVGEDVADGDLFEKYHYASSSVPTLVRHFEDYATALTARYGESSPIHLLEIGCNDGVLLRKLPPSWKLAGADPSDVARNAATLAGKRYDLAPRAFTPDLVEEMRWTESWDIVTGSNCLAHISNLEEVFVGVFMALKPAGWFWVEVHDLTALLKGAQWDTIYHEHKAEWSESSLKHCLEKVGFELREVQRLPLHGGILRCCFQKTGTPKEPRTAERRKDLVKLREAYANRRQINAVRKLMKAQQRGLPIAAYGASGRASVYLNQMSNLRFSYIVDDAPLRKNRFIPGAATPILDRSILRQEPPAKVLITAWNCREDIVKKNPDFSGQWLTAFPAS